METEIRIKSSAGGFRQFTKNHGIIFITIGVIVAATIAVWIKNGDPWSFLAAQNFINILRANSVTGVIAFGMAFVIISGNIDLSVGSQMTLVGIITFNVINVTGSILAGLLTAVLSGVALSMICGFIVTKGAVPSFIITLGLSYIYRSLSIFSLNSGGITVGDKAFQAISNTSLGPIPLPILYFFIVFLLYFYISKYTVMGRRIYAVGSNQQATRLSGINTNWVKIQAFALLGLTVGLAAVIEGSRMNSINSSSTGNGYDLNTIAMAVVGGIAMEGGKGSIVNCLFGIIILAVINTSMTILGVNVYLVNAIKGAIIIFAVLLLRSRGKLN
ncbi:ribose ABC transporter permease [Clostridia bacterium]|nr:ribose ABC transporter permease [Clostridia bacterium]